MNLRETLDTLIRAGVVVNAAEDGRVLLSALFESHPITAETRVLAQKHRDILRRYAMFASEANALILDSTRRIAAAWPQGYPLEGDAWDAYERQLHEAYWSLDVDSLKCALEARERFALRAFQAYRTEVPNV